VLAKIKINSHDSEAQQKSIAAQKVTKILDAAE